MNICRSIKGEKITATVHVTSEGYWLSDVKERQGTDWRAGFITETFKPAHTPGTIRFQVHDKAVECGGVSENWLEFVRIVSQKRRNEIL
jgi:hypothetical protein